MPTLRRVRPRTTGGEDRLSALPDELIRLIVGRLDTRTALSTAILARRWARIPRELPALDFRVSDILPPEYDLLRGMALVRCELGAMRAFADGIASFLEAGGGGDDESRRRVETLRLEFFQAHDGGCVERLIAAAAGSWGVDDLEIVARPASYSYHHDAPAYVFPHGCLDDGARRRLRSLTLGNCTLPPLHAYESLTTLALQGVAASTPVAVYERLFSDCARLQVLHLRSCSCTSQHLVVDAPGSAITELVVEDCAFSEITLRALPALSRLACLHSSATVMLRFGSVPRLTRVNLSFWESEKPLDILGNAPAAAASLVLRFTGPSRWVLPRHVATPFRGLKRLLVADLPASWDVSWPRILLLFARSLEVLHIHVAPPDSDCDGGEPGEEIIWWPEPKRRHRCLKELVMIGFTQTPRQMQYLRDAVSVCRSLQRLVLLRDGHVRYDGLWDWEMVRRPDCSWSHDDKMAVTRMTKSRSRPLVDVIFG